MNELAWLIGGALAGSFGLPILGLAISRYLGGVFDPEPDRPEEMPEVHGQDRRLP